MKEAKQRLTLDRPVSYQIKVPGQLDEKWSEWNGTMAVTVERPDDGPSTTILTGTVDQAALQGVLRQLYALGLPLISVLCLACDTEEDDRIHASEGRQLESPNRMPSWFWIDVVVGECPLMV